MDPELLKKGYYTANIKLYTHCSKDLEIINHWQKHYSRLPFITYLLTMVEKQVEEEKEK